MEVKMDLYCQYVLIRSFDVTKEWNITDGGI